MNTLCTVVLITGLVATALAVAVALIETYTGKERNVTRISVVLIVAAIAVGLSAALPKVVEHTAPQAGTFIALIVELTMLFVAMAMTDFIRQLGRTRRLAKY